MTDVVTLVLLVAMLVVVPASVPLLPRLPPRSDVVALVAAVPASVALLIDQGPVAGLLVVPWLVTSAVGAGALGWAWWTRARTRDELVWPIAAAYLVVGAVWLFADRLGIEPVGVHPPFVVLTAVHFHYAGFAAATLAGCVRRHQPTNGTAALATALVVTTPPLIAAGFTFLGALQIIGAVLLTIGLWLVAWTTLRHVAPGQVARARVLLWISSLSVVAPMVLAVQWAVGNNLGTPALSIPDMARTHGVLNAFGFALAGVVAWRVVRREPAPTHRSAPTAS